MITHQTATWEGDVLPCWRRNAKDAPRPNSDIWRPLPAGVEWSRVSLEISDIPNLYLLGSSDFHDSFGTYKVANIQAPFPQGSQDRHHTLPLSMQTTLSEGGRLDFPIVVAESLNSNIVIIDGNHRIIAHHLNGSLGGLEVYAGVLAGIHDMFSWSWHARAEQ